MAMSPRENTAPWTAERLFDLLPRLGRLRVISVCGPSVFEAICEAGPYEMTGGAINMITPSFHWHFYASRLGYLRSHDEIHKRSGRRVLFIELRERLDDPPFLRIYVYRPAGEEFSPEAVDAFTAAHLELSEGVATEQETL